MIPVELAEFVFVLADGGVIDGEGVENLVLGHRANEATIAFCGEMGKFFESATSYLDGDRQALRDVTATAACAAQAVVPHVETLSKFSLSDLVELGEDVSYNATTFLRLADALQERAAMADDARSRSALQEASMNAVYVARRLMELVV